MILYKDGRNERLSNKFYSRNDLPQDIFEFAGKIWVDEMKHKYPDGILKRPKSADETLEKRHIDWLINWVIKDIPPPFPHEYSDIYIDTYREVIINNYRDFLNSWGQKGYKAPNQAPSPFGP